MANENGRPWYRNPVFWAPIIAILVAAIITFLLRVRKPPDFGISIEPIEASVQPGGVTQTMATLESIRKYEHSIRISASGQPPGVIISFNPPTGQPRPLCASTVTISIGSNVPIGDYKIIIKGSGADGKEHSCNYFLTVKAVDIKDTIIKPTTTPEPPDSIVYITKTGKRYHRTGCQYLSESCISISLEEARRDYTPCKVCNPLD